MLNTYTLALKIIADNKGALQAIEQINRKAGKAGPIGSMFSGVSTVANGLLETATKTLGVVGSIGGALMGAFSSALSIVGKIGVALLKLPMAGLKFGLAGVAGVAAAGYVAHKSLGPAAQMERDKIKLGALGKGHLFDFLSTASAGKPFQSDEVIQAGVLLEAFSLSSVTVLGTVMDAAAAMNKPLEQIVTMLGYAKSGQSGEAVQSAGKIGISRDMLKAMGIKFNNAGAVTNKDDLAQALVKAMSGRFGGVANKIGTESYSGAVSDLGDSMFRAFSNAFENLLPYATQVVRGISEMVTTAGEFISGLNWDGFGQSFLKYFTAAKTVMNGMFTGSGREAIKSAFKDAWDILVEDGPLLWDTFKITALSVFNTGSGLVGSAILTAFGYGVELMIAAGPSLMTAWETVSHSVYKNLLGAAKYLTSGILTAVTYLIKGLNAIPGINVEGSGRMQQSLKEENVFDYWKKESDKMTKKEMSGGDTVGTTLLKNKFQALETKAMEFKKNGVDSSFLVQAGKTYDRQVESGKKNLANIEKASPSKDDNLDGMLFDATKLDAKLEAQAAETKKQTQLFTEQRNLTIQQNNLITKLTKALVEQGTYSE